MALESVPVKFGDGRTNPLFNDQDVRQAHAAAATVLPE